MNVRKSFLYILLVAVFYMIFPFSLSASQENKTRNMKNRLAHAEQRKFDYFYYEGAKLKNAGKYDAAFDLFSYCYELDSTSSAVLYELAMFQLQRNRPEKAIEMMRKAVKNSPDNFTYCITLAGLERNMGMYGEAAESYQRLADKNPGKIELYYYLAEAMTQKGDIDEAIKAYDKLEESMGMNETLSMQKFKLYRSIEEPEKAFNEIIKLADKYPMNARYQLLIGDLYLEDKENEKAYACYQKAHEIDPNDPRYIVSMANYYDAIGDKEASENEIKAALVNEELDIDTKVAILSRYIQRLQQTKQGLAKADLLFLTLLEQHPEDTELKMMYGSLLLALEKPEEAKLQFQLVSEMAPDNEAAWQQLLNLALKEENVSEIIRICKKCIQLFPNSPEYYFYMGIGYFQEKEYQKTLDTYYAGLKIISDENRVMKSNFYGQIGDVYYQLGNMEETYKAYDEALKFNENNAFVLNNYSYFLTLDKKDLKKAERMAASCIKLEPDNATYIDTYAWVFFMEGNYSLAKIYIENALSKDKTNSAELVDHYGDILYMSGEKEKAIEQWKKAKEMGKESTILDEKIAKGEYIEDTTEKKE